MGQPEAADLFLREYEMRTSVSVTDIGAWDVQAAARAKGVLDDWVPNYAGIGRPDLDANALHHHLATWSAWML